MALPKQATPIFTTTIPSIGEKVKFRPFLVKEEKALLIAQQTEDARTMVETMKSVLNSVIADDIDINNLAIFDLEYLFLQVRSKSAGEEVELLFACDDDHGDMNEKARSKVTINIENDIEVIKDKSHSNNIPLFNDVGIIMKYPTIDITESYTDLDNMDNLIDIISNLIDYIYDAEQTYNSPDISSDELKEFIGNLTPEQFEKIENFFITMPKLQVEVEYTCPICGKEHKKTLEGLANFI